MRKKDALKRIEELEKELSECGNRLNTLGVQYEKMLTDYKVCYSALEASQKRIKELSEENEALASQADILRSNNAKLCEQNEDYRAAAEVVQSAEEQEVAEEATAQDAPSNIEDSKANIAATKATAGQREVKLSEIEKFGSGVIGNVVVEATRIIGKLSGKATPNAKDTLTLVLGRTEVLKSEVLAIVKAEDLDDEQKMQRINDCKAQAMEYLASVDAQE